MYSLMAIWCNVCWNLIPFLFGVICMWILDRFIFAIVAVATNSSSCNVVFFSFCCFGNPISHLDMRIVNMTDVVEHTMRINWHDVWHSKCTEADQRRRTECLIYIWTFWTVHLGFRTLFTCREWTIHIIQYDWTYWTLISTTTTKKQQKNVKIAWFNVCEVNSLCRL